MTEISQSAGQTVRKLNRLLESRWHGQAVVLEFSEPIRRDQIGMFHRVHLNQKMLIDGEEKTYRAKLFQPENLSMLAKCPLCKMPMERPYQWSQRCINHDCDAGGKLREFGPRRGIMRVATFEEYVTGTEIIRGSKVEMVNAVVLFLDRRYPDAVLDAVKRGCGILCEYMGWRML